MVIGYVNGNNNNNVFTVFERNKEKLKRRYLQTKVNWTEPQVFNKRDELVNTTTTRRKLKK